MAARTIRSTTPVRDTQSGSMAVRNASCARLARWQPYFLGSNTIPNKRALPSLVRPQLAPSSLYSGPAPIVDSLLQPAPSLSPVAPTIQPKDALAELAPVKGSQLPTPTSSPPGMPPTLLEQTSSGYVLELSLAILASIYFQPGYQHATPNHNSPEDAATRVTSPKLVIPLTPPIPETSIPPSSVNSRAPSKNTAPLTPQSPRPSLSASLPTPPPLPAQQPAIRVQCLPSKRELARHLNSLGALECQSGAAPAGSMRWFLTELFKRAALPGLIIRVAAGYVLRCRSAITQALHSVALKTQSTSRSAPSTIDRTPQERVLTDARRVFLAALVLACKFVFDKPYDNRSWSLISGLGSRDIGECERVVGEVLGWRLWIGAGRAPSQ